MHFILPYFIIILIVIQLYLKKKYTFWLRTLKKILGKGTESQFNKKAGYKLP